MGNLEENIKTNYQQRASKSHLYNSQYSKYVDEELLTEIKLIIDRYLKPSATVLEIGAGLGGNVNIFTNCGLKKENIFLNELLPDRIETIKTNWPELKLFEGNAIEIDFNQQFDCVFQSAVFTSVLEQQHRQALAQKMWSLLKPGGIILWYDFIYNNPANAAVKKVTVNEAIALFPNAVESQIKKITLAPPIGRRVGKMYKLFNLPFLRSHILAAFKK